MNTTKPFSTISYNSKIFLRSKLNELLENKIINEWYFIHHKGETDWFTNEREKDHFHVYMSPCHKVDCDALRELFQEIDPTCDKPLGCMPFQPSKIDDWIMYGIHDEHYLNTKGEVKEFSYSWKDIVGYDDEAIKRAVKHASAWAYKEVRKRERVASTGLLKSFNDGIISTREVMGYAIIQREYEKLGLVELSKQINNFVEDKVGANPFKKED